MKNLLCVSVLFLCLNVIAQEKLPFIDYETVSELASEQASKENYSEAVEILHRISKNDSSYCSVLTSKSYYSILQEKYKEAIVFTDEGLSLGCDSESNLYFYINKGVSLANLDRFEEAIKVYDEGLKIFPKNPKLWYNKGISYENLENVPAAIEAYQKTIVLNPIHRNAHLKLGSICYRQNLMSQAMLSFNMSLMIEPDSERGFALLKYLNDIVSVKNENEPIRNLTVSEDDEAFEDIDLIISNRVVLDSDYDTGNKINIPLVKQNHALLEQLKEFEGNGGFWDQYYVPLYVWIAENGYFDHFTYTINYAIKNEDYEKVIEKNKDKVSDFIKVFVAELYNIYGTNEKEGMSYNYSDAVLQAEGPYKNDITIGDWKFYDDNGRLMSEGSYDKKGEREGKWTWYHDNGAVKEVALFENGKLSGENKLYYDDGSPYIHTISKNGEFDGEYKYYLKQGGLKQKKTI